MQFLKFGIVSMCFIVSTQSFAVLPNEQEISEIDHIIYPSERECKTVTDIKAGNTCVYSSLAPITEKMKAGLDINYDWDGRRTDFSLKVVGSIFNSGRVSLWRQDVNERYSDDTIEFFKEAFENKHVNLKAVNSRGQSYLDLAADKCATPIVDIILQNGGEELVNEQWLTTAIHGSFSYLSEEARNRCLDLSNKLFSIAENRNTLDQISRQTIFNLFYNFNNYLDQSDEDLGSERESSIQTSGGFNTGYQLAQLPENIRNNIEKIFKLKISPMPKSPKPQNIEKEFSFRFKEPGLYFDEETEVKVGPFKKAKIKTGDYWWNRLDSAQKEWLCWISSADEAIENLLNSGFEKKDFVGLNITGRSGKTDGGREMSVIGNWTVDVFYPYCKSLK